MIEHVPDESIPEAWLTPPVGVASGPLGAVQVADREIARQTALRARAVVEFAESRPASVDRVQGEKGAMSAERWAARPELLRPVSEWAARELSIALSITQGAADTLMERSLALVRRLPGTLAALEAGALHPGHLWPMLEKVAPIADDAIRGEVEAALLSWAAGRVATPAQLGARARHETLRRGARAAAQELAQAVAGRGVDFSPDRVDGMGAVTAALLLPEAKALVAALGAYADAIDDEPGAPPRTRAQKMADCLMDLVLRPGECDLPPVQVLLTVVASVPTLLGGDQPGEIDGHPVPAELVRQLLRALPGAGLPAAPAPTSGEQQHVAESTPELQRCILAVESDDPASIVEAELAGWIAEWQAQAAADAGDAEPADGDAAGGERWWAQADRAVDDAGMAMWRAEQALAHAARMVRTAAFADADDEASWQAGPGGRVTAAEDAMTALVAADATARDQLARLLERTAGGGLVERPRIALTDALSGALLALTDLPGLTRAARCDRPGCSRRPATCTHDLSGQPGLGPPPPTNGYRPGADLDRFLRARDRRCRFPGCRRRVPRGGELDHDRPYPDGPTSAANLAGYCTTDHRGKHQAPGWQQRLDADGTLTVTTPTGLVAVTGPPPY